MTESYQDWCDECQVVLGEVMNEGFFVCRRCDKELKRQFRKVENKKWRQEEREDANPSYRNYKGRK